jgi:hypothetical protein
MFDWEELDVNEVLTLINENVPNPSPELRDQLYGLISATEHLIAEKNCLDWVGLTDEEIQEMRLKTLDSVATNYETYKAIEAKLKEKNHE